MAEKLMKYEKNCTTGEETYTEFTADEVAEYEKMSKEIAANKAKADADAKALAELKVSAKAKLIAGTPLTAEEVDTLVI
jgi:uncharacterized coiled-coil DUF342 family protein